MLEAVVVITRPKGQIGFEFGVLMSVEDIMKKVDEFGGKMVNLDQW